jgi:hypothetical protein
VSIRLPRSSDPFAFHNTPEPPFYDQPPVAVLDEIRLALSMHLNLMLVGDVDPVIAALMPEFEEPLMISAPGSVLVLPPPNVVSTLVLRGIGSIDDDDQQRLLDWLTISNGTTQIVSTTAVALGGPMAQRAFDDRLYYRLNTVCVHVPFAHGLIAPISG